MSRRGVKRTQYEIYWEILTYCETPRLFTSIIQRCDLNSKNGQEHLDFLERKGYVARNSQGGKTLYSATRAAKEFVDLFARLYLELYDDSPEFKI
ncbi:MAG: hypothetical protein H5T32_02330 [Candidatus Methanosuratus sp.]|nr:hypothetical protein [Candidatus Methanosuratincola sp.]